MGVMKDYHRHSAKVTRSKRWKALRLEALRRDGWRCAQCGARGRLEVEVEEDAVVGLGALNQAPGLGFWNSE